MADTKVEQTTPTQEKAEEVVDGADSDDDLPALEGAENPEGGANAKGKQSRSEKKTRKALQKLGLKEVTGITKISVRKGKGILFVVNDPEVFKSPSTETYVIFGQAKEADSEGINPAILRQLAEQSQANAAAAEGAKVEEVAEKPAEGASESVDETGLNAKDIELVMAQGNVNRAAAVKALRNAKGDMVTAIMELTLQNKSS